MNVEKPFLVYAVRSPFFDSSILASAPQDSPVHDWIAGSAFILSGGVIDERGDSPSVWMSGIIGSTSDMSDALFVEDAVNNSVNELDEVVLVLPTLAASCEDAVCAAQAAGMRTVRAQDSLVISGRAVNLLKWHWLECLTGLGFELMSSRSGTCPLQQSLRNVGKGVAVRSFMARVWLDMASNPGLLRKHLEGCTLYAGLAEPDAANVILVTDTASTDSVTQAIDNAAKQHGFAVFRAGASAGLDYSYWQQWQLLPPDWRRI